MQHIHLMFCFLQILLIWSAKVHFPSCFCGTILTLIMAIDRQAADHYHPRPRQHSSSPTPNGLHVPIRPPYASHKRRDSDTLRNGPYSQPSGSPTVVSDQHAVPARHSPSIKGMMSSNAAVSSSSYSAAKHRRSPTAPDAPTTSASLNPEGREVPPGKTWAAGDRNSGELHEVPMPEKEKEKELEKERARERERGHRDRPRSHDGGPHPLQQRLSQGVPQATHAAPPPPPPSSSEKISDKEKPIARAHMVVSDNFLTSSSCQG